MANPNYLDKGISPMQPVINTAINANQAGKKTQTGVLLDEKKCLGFINLRLKADDSKGLQAASKALGIDLPTINTRTHTEHIAVLGFGPSEWLISVASGTEAATIQRLTQALGNAFSLVCDVSGGTTQLDITGANAQDLLEKGTYVDLHDSVFKTDTLYATQIAHAPAVIVKNDHNNFSLIVRRSFSDHIARWAVDGAAEYGFSFT